MRYSAGFYVHSLLTITLCAWLLYLIAYQWVSDWYAIGGAPYVEGLLFYLLTLWLVMCGVRSGQTHYGSA
jgi:hypothetical protein